MDYDGANQHAVTHLGSISLSPRVSPDGSRIAFSSLTKSGLGNPDVFAGPEPDGYLSRVSVEPTFSGMVAGWHQAGVLLLAQRRSGNLCRSMLPAANLKRLTSFKGPDVSPAWNRKTGAQIAWVSGRTGLPQIYTMEADGTNVQRLTDQGYAVSPSWSPNGQFLAVLLDAPVRPGSAGRAGHLHDGHRQQAVGAADPRWRAQ